MKLETDIIKELVENQRRDKTAALTDAHRIVEIVDKYITSCIPKEDGWAGPTSEFKTNLFNNLYEKNNKCICIKINKDTFQTVSNCPLHQAMVR